MFGWEEKRRINEGIAVFHESLCLTGKIGLGFVYCSPFEMSNEQFSICKQSIEKSGYYKK